MKRVQKILDIAKAQQERDHDSVFIICGPEGSSKSNLGLWGTEYLGGNIENVALDKKDFVRVLATAKDKGIFNFDEAGDGLFSRDFSSKLSKDLVKTFMVVRAKRLIGFLILPSFFMLDIYFRKHRVKGLFYVYRRGRVAFYDKRGIDKILAFGEKFQKLIGKPSFFDTFPVYKGALLEEYKKKKVDKIEETLTDLQQKHLSEGQYLK